MLKGIGKPPGQMDPKAFLLQKFSMLARERVKVFLSIYVCLNQTLGNDLSLYFYFFLHLCVFVGKD